MQLSDDLLGLLTRPSPCTFTTLMPDGSPHATLTWVDTDGRNIVINSVRGHRKVRNVERDPRVALTVLDPEQLGRYVGVRGRVVDITTEGAVEHIDRLAQRYLGRDYPWFGGRDQVRLILTVEADVIT
ncbi:PPOX class F420-dependent oxidoreductase [Pseudonocardia sp. GCM10023141]|uniref:PPOX class F420-dependent oxidoreductase n=1 Tax=Pseudonocardia sp. GCM10023141 TaxID=3252653 RepID=UPI003617ED4E